MKKSKTKPLHFCGGGFIQIEDALDGRPQFQCTKCKCTWTEGKSGGESLAILVKKKKK